MFKHKYIKNATLDRLCKNWTVEKCNSSRKANAEFKNQSVYELNFSKIKAFMN